MCKKRADVINCACVRDISYDGLKVTRLSQLTGLFVFVLFARVTEGHGASEERSQNSPAERGHGMNSHQTADESVATAFQKRHDIRPHVIRVLLPEILQDKSAILYRTSMCVFNIFISFFYVNINESC